MARVSFAERVKRRLPVSKTFLWVLILIASGVAGFLLFHPIHRRLLNLVFLGCLGGTWLGVTILLWNSKALRVLCLLLPVLVALPFLLPGKAIDPQALRTEYMQRLNSFEGTDYVWGGETARGIDCSGLPRRALRDALLATGFKHANGRAFRAFFKHWWFDASAEALGQGDRDYTTPLGGQGVLRELELEKLLPGDLAVTTSGDHILAYAGDGRWIQADPAIGVKTLHGVRDPNT